MRRVELVGDVVHTERQSELAQTAEHELNLAAAVAYRIALMQQGRIVTQGKPDEVLTSQRISGVYDVEARVQRDALNGRLQVTAAI